MDIRSNFQLNEVEINKLIEVSLLANSCTDSTKLLQEVKSLWLALRHLHKHDVRDLSLDKRSGMVDAPRCTEHES